MIALTLQIVFSSVFTLVIKWAQIRGKEDEITFGAINYIVAATCILPVLYFNRPATISTAAMCTGASMGVIYFMAYFLVIQAIRNVGAASTTVVGVLSILLPIGLATVLYNEHPRFIQWLGIGFALIALTLIGVPAKEETPIESHEPKSNEAENKESKFTKSKWLISLVLVGFFLLCGFSRVAQEAFKHLVAEDQHPDQRPIFLASAFTAAAIPSIVTLFVRRRKIKATELGIGTAMGVSNILQTFFILQALGYFSGFIVFPVSSAGGVAMVTLVAVLLMGERLTRRTLIGISLSVVALFMLNSV